MRWGSEEAVRAARLAGGAAVRRTTRCEPMGKVWGGDGVAEATCGYTLTTFFHRQETKTKSKMSTTACDSKLSSSPHGHLRIFSLLTVFVSWRWVARVVSGSGRVTRQTRAGREVTEL